MVATCPHCKQKLNIEEALAGQQRICPACGLTFTVPSPPEEPPRLAETAKTPLESPTGNAIGRASILPSTTSAPSAADSPVKPTSVPPPLPPRPPAGPAGAAAAGQAPFELPPPLPRSVSSAATQATLERLISSLARSLSIRKLGFFLLGAIATLLVCGILQYIGFWVSHKIGFRAGYEVMMIIVVIITVGMFLGVLPGGLAYLTHMERRQRPPGITDAIHFCLRRFMSLFGAALLTVVLLMLLPVIVNGLIALITYSGEIGSALTSLLFLPQLLVNFVLVLAALVGVLVPCIIVVEGFGAFRAISQFGTCIRHQVGPLTIQLTLTMLLGGNVLSVLVLLVSVALAPTLAANCPSELVSLFGPRPRFGEFSHFGEMIRSFSLMVVWLLVMVYPVVYHVVSFTAYYETVRSSTPGRRLPAKTTGPQIA